jgi:hypothetical protein
MAAAAEDWSRPLPLFGKSLCAMIRPVPKASVKFQPLFAKFLDQRLSDNLFQGGIDAGQIVAQENVLISIDLGNDVG